jgi:Fe-S oxidoreductase
MAKLKYEFENRYYQTHRRPWRDYAFGYFHLTAALASAFAPLTNLVMSVPSFKNILAKNLGITPHRPFPEFTSRRPRFQRDRQNDSKTILFLSDPFARYIEPETEQAAFEILSLCGYKVHALPILGAGASLLSKGFVEAAKRHARKMLETLDQIAPAREAVIVGIEPPEIYCLKHDYFDLLPEHADVIASRVAQTWLLDEFLIRSDEFQKLRVAKMKEIHAGNVIQTTPKVYFHPHCHQRAEGLAEDGFPAGAQATVELLRSCGYDVELSDAGCCGMAGTFGYEAEHYELSMQIAELKLLPRLRQLNEIHQSSESNRKSQIVNRKSYIVSTGAACRMQIQQGADVTAVHSVQLLAEFMKS